MDGTKIILGLMAEVTILGRNNRQETLLARVDTGATGSSIDVSLAERLGLNTSSKSKIIKSASGVKRRPVVTVHLKMDGLIMVEEFSIADRNHMTYKVLLGQNILKKGNFLIDPRKEVSP